MTWSEEGGEHVRESSGRGYVNELNTRTTVGGCGGRFMVFSRQQKGQEKESRTRRRREERREEKRGKRRDDKKGTNWVGLPSMQQHQAVAVSQVVIPAVGICLRRIGVTRVQLSPPEIHRSSSRSSSAHLLRFFRKMDFWNLRHANTSNKSLIEMLQTTGSLKSERVKDIMKELDRGIFVPKGQNPYADNPVPIGYNATISAPHMHAECLQLLEKHLQPGMHALDVGSGTGYLTAAFILMVGEQGRVVGVEHIPELVEQSVDNVQRSKAAPLLASGCLSLHVGDGRKGWPESAPYNAIHVGAAAESIPQALVDQLKVGGRLVIPVGDIFQDLKVIDKEADGTTKEQVVTAVRYVPLTSQAAQLRGS